MKKFYKTVFLLITLIFLTTYTPGKLNFSKEKNIFFFTIRNIEIVNNELVNKNEILEKLSHIYKQDLFSVKKNDIENPLKSINFFDKIEVKKKYPNTISIKIYETKPIAVLFKKNTKYLIDNASNLIQFNENIYKKSYPNVFGDGAEDYFIDFFNKFKINNFPYKNIKNYYFFQINRWDVELLNGKTIKLPEKKINKSIKQLAELMKNKKFENYNLIDLRIHDKIIVE